MAATILSRALHEKGVSDDQLVGVLYLLGRCAEKRGQREQAVEYYQRVFVVDIQFRDVGERLAAHRERAARERRRRAHAHARPLARFATSRRRCASASRRSSPRCGASSPPTCR